MKAAFKNNLFRYTVFFLIIFLIGGNVHAAPRVMYDGYLTVDMIPYVEEKTKEFMPELQIIEEKVYQENDEGQMRRMVNTSTGALSFLGTGLREYQVYLPKDYDENKKYPALMLLHDDGYTGVSLVEKWKRGADKAGLILLGPSSLGGNKWLLDKTSGDILEAVAKDAADTYSIDLNKLYLFGYGYGGALATHIPVYKPDLFAAIAVHQGGSSEHNMVDGMETPTRKTPIAFFVNRDEQEVMHAVKDSVEAFAKWKYPTHLYIFQKPDNWYYHNENEINLEVLRYLSKHKKQ